MGEGICLCGHERHNHKHTKSGEWERCLQSYCPCMYFEQEEYSDEAASDLTNDVLKGKSNWPTIKTREGGA